MPDGFVNQLHYGDNLERLRGDGVDKAIPDEIADLIYLDPPFNSARNYNLLFKQHKGQDSPAQIMTFVDTWKYSPTILHHFRDDGRNADLFHLIDSLHRLLGPTEMMAYLLMMAPRILELHRKLKRTGSLFLHCDPVASHYLKLILDQVFGPERFVNEIIWKRSSAHNDTKQGMKRCGKIHDTILFYSKSADYKWNPIYTPHDESYVAAHYRHKDKSGRLYREGDLTAAKGGGDTSFEWRVKRKIGGIWVADLDDEYRNPKEDFEYRGIPPYHGRFWAYSRSNMAKMWEQGAIIHNGNGFPQFVRYLDEQPGVVIQDLWTDIVPPGGNERRGYPTQKPLALLERIIAASTDEGDLVMDPFAGCGTAIVAAERMGRKWIGIDITYLAISEVVDRLTMETNAVRVDAKGRRTTLPKPGEAPDPPTYQLVGTPKDEDAAQALFRDSASQNHKPFEQWAVMLVGGKNQEKQGADRGIDGRIQLHDTKGNYREGVIQVKGGNSLTLSAVRDFASVIESSKAVFGIMISQREPTTEMKLVAEGMGFADWPGTRKIPRYQILTTKGILEDGQRPIIPENWTIPPEVGVGKQGQSSMQYEQEGLDFEFDSDNPASGMPLQG